MEIALRNFRKLFLLSLLTFASTNSKVKTENMVEFGGSAKFSAVILTGASVSLLILLTLYTELAHEVSQ